MTQKEDVCYLIERNQEQHQDPPLWWAGTRAIGEWTDQPGIAVRFSRASDAWLVGEMMHQLGKPHEMWTVVEHMHY